MVIPSSCWSLKSSTYFYSATGPDWLRSNKRGCLPSSSSSQRSVRGGWSQAGFTKALATPLCFWPLKVVWGYNVTFILADQIYLNNSSYGHDFIAAVLICPQNWRGRGNVRLHTFRRPNRLKVLEHLTMSQHQLKFFRLRPVISFPSHCNRAAVLYFSRLSVDGSR